MQMQLETVTSLSEVTNFLSRCGLLTSDISDASPSYFFGLRNQNALAGVIGFEQYGEMGLLRSLAVAPTMRSEGIGRQLVTYTEDFARGKGIRDLFLLTNTATLFFSRLGYKVLPRRDAPAAIRQTQQFAHLCPASSDLMHKSITTTTPTPAH